MRRRRQKNDRRDAHHLLDLLTKGEFPAVWRPSPREREQRLLIRHLVRLVRQRTRWINVLRALVYNYNLRIPRGYLSKARLKQMCPRQTHSNSLQPTPAKIGGISGPRDLRCLPPF